MKLHRFIGDFDLSARSVVLLGDAADQIRSVLRMQPGNEIVLCDGNGKEALSIISSVGKGKVVADIMEISVPDRELEKRITLFVAKLKKENFELVVQKAVECGVAKIVPVITERTVKTGLNMERMKKIIREAAEQSGRTVLSEIAEPVSFSEGLASAPGEKIIFQPGGEGVDVKGSSREISLFIGPEGGFSDREIKEAEDLGARAVSLGPLILRAETAAIVVSYMARYL